MDKGRDIYTSLACARERKETLSLDLLIGFVKVKKTPVVMDIMIISVKWYLLKEHSERNIVRTNRRCVSSLKTDTQMKRGKHDSQACKTLSSTNRTKKKSIVLLCNYHDPRVVKDIERQVKGSKVKEKLLCPIGIQ